MQKNKKNNDLEEKNFVFSTLSGDLDECKKIH
jgi:hypothetical protein